MGVFIPFLALGDDAAFLSQPPIASLHKRGRLVSLGPGGNAAESTVEPIGTCVIAPSLADYSGSIYNLGSDYLDHCLHNAHGL